MKIVFMGTPDFAVPALKALIKEFEVCAVFTQPDKPKGRGKKLSMSPVKEVALEHHIPVYQPTVLRKDNDSINIIEQLKPDFIVVIAYGQILTEEVLKIPSKGCINVHGSILPKYRGAAPVNWAIIQGEKISGNTTMLMDKGLDTGDILLKDEVVIDDDMTAGQLHDILMERSADLLVRTLEGICRGEITPVKQGETTTMYASMLNKEMAKIDWHKSAEEVHNFIRGLNPWPVAHTNYKDIVMKIHKSTVIEKNTQNEPGIILKVDKKGIVVACKMGSILIKNIQFPGKKSMDVSEFIKGNTIEEGVVLI
ncbi:methionyl-tRNA formyltransferase [Hathewaya proteolytica DSM 3090]|uniref:Methionyl-tRNA formyltransferase n=1 Tax=Hathewaya proteolytica DSM 3090 TaxID=1121331 RepID=A0A1M6JAL4_9CLOT|nr:methionyl-tRNA formyltransferase [Hathewaya proteolytica]SHJ43714.1 methionyl-tRNA formyltransferase [Hathewaya proteolytica DSM 3090]